MVNFNVKSTFIAVPLLLVGLLGSAQTDDLSALIAGITDPSADVRAEAWKAAGPVGAKAVVPLGEQANAEDPGIAKAALAALANITYYAGRPGASEERAAVAAELTRLLDPAYAAQARREVLHLLSLVATAAEVPAIAALLPDEEVGEDARIALDRIEDPSAAEALAVALVSCAPPQQVRIVQSLAHKQVEAAKPILLRLARTTQESEVAWACLDALAEFGVPPNKVFARDRSFSQEEHARYTNGFLRAAAACMERGDLKEAEGLYAAVSQFYAKPSQATAALVGLADLKSEKVIRHALGYLAEPGIRATAIDVLKRAEIPAIDELLPKAYVRTNTYKQAEIIRILAARNAPALPALIETARQDASAEVRVAALECAGESPALEDLLEVMRTGSPWGADRAAAACIARAQEAPNTAETAGLLEAVVRANVANELKVQALQGLEAAAAPASYPLFEELLMGVYEPDLEVAATAFAGGFREDMEDDTALAQAAGRAYVAVCAVQPDSERAKATLMAVAEADDSSPVGALAMEKLRALGVNTQIIAQRKGFVTQWRLLGPFPNDGGSAFAKSFFPEDADPVPDTVDFDGATFEWRDVQTDRVPAAIDLRAQFDPHDNVAAYALAEVNMIAVTPVLCLLGSDDGCEFWVNGEKLHEVNAPRGMAVDGDRVETTLHPGVNRLLLKVLQGGGDWQFCLRIAGRDGVPLDLSSRE